MTQPVCIQGSLVCETIDAEVLTRIAFPLTQLNSPVQEIVPVSKQVVVTECEALSGKVLLSGTLRKVLQMLTGTGRGAGSPVCEVSRLASDTALLVECPFATCIAVPGARPGDVCVVETACIDAESEHLLDVDHNRQFDRLEETACIRVRIRLERTQPVAALPACECPSPTTE